MPISQPPAPGEQDKFKGLLRRTVIVPIVALVILAAVLLGENYSLNSALQWVDHTDQVIGASQQLVRLMIDMESGIRGYLGSGNEIFLQPYYETKSLIDSKFDSLNRLVSDNVAQQARLAAMRSRYDEWRSYQQARIELRRSTGNRLDPSLLGKQLMDAVREEHGAFIAAEDQLRTERVRRARNASALVTLTCTLLTLCVGGFLAVFTRRQMHLLAARFQESLDSTEKRAESLRESEEQLRSSQAKLQGVVGSAMDAIISVDEQQRIVVFNQAAEAVFQCAASQAIGSTLDRFIPTSLREVHHEHIRRFGSSGTTARSMFSPSVLTAVRSNGEEFPIEATISQVNADGEKLYTVILRDITERKRAEDALRASEQRWGTTLQSIGDAVISTDAAGTVVFMNDVAQKLTGWTLPDAKGKDLSVVFDIIQEVTRIKPEDPVAKVIRLGKVIGLANHTVLIRRDGAEIPIEDSAAPIRNPEGQIEGVVLVFHDVLEERKVEAALRSSDRLATTGKLAATIAHEIHNPLDAVGNLLFLIGQDAKDDLTRKYVATASAELTRVTQMTRQMLVFQREAAKPVPVKISEILESVTSLFERKIASAGIRLAQQIDFDGQILVQPGELRQIFANLVGNAIEAVGPRRGTITLRAYASQERRRGRRGLRVVVADDGPGIPEEVRGKIFEPFFTTKGEGGTGLGLWIASDILRKYDGTMRLRSSTRPQHSGTCFSIFLPFEIGTD